VVLVFLLIPARQRARYYGGAIGGVGLATAAAIAFAVLIGGPKPDALEVARSLHTESAPAAVDFALPGGANPFFGEADRLEAVRGNVLKAGEGGDVKDMPLGAAKLGDEAVRFGGGVKAGANAAVPAPPGAAGAPATPLASVPPPAAM